MKNIIIIVIAIIVFSTTVVKAQAPALTQEQINEAMTIPQIIEKFSSEYHLSDTMMKTIIFRESSFNPNANHDNYQGKGVTGYHKDTFNDDLKVFKKEVGEDLSYESSFDQIRLMCWTFQNFPEYKRHRWTTYTKYINNKTS